MRVLPNETNKNNGKKTNNPAHLGRLAIFMAPNCTSLPERKNGEARWEAWVVREYKDSWAVVKDSTGPRLL